ncbi:hypothetical protein [Chryseolinea sp. H1M3-3]|uniref:hypothetical protein n=1 Tax=Chryseolinea sp. H1M3-3 TaxID=3034144 RepID=UPI0023EC2021|nr:hypothetical protein [Chryseolinea sp. H1M3-3]
MSIAYDEVLVYKQGRQAQSTVKRLYIRWRSEQATAIPLRCDNLDCTLHNPPLTWNGKPIVLILDHKNGVNGDNRTKNLQLLCPNCSSQKTDHGGGNKGKVSQFEGGFVENLPSGKKKYTLPAEAGKYHCRS